MDTMTHLDNYIDALIHNVHEGNTDADLLRRIERFLGINLSVSAANEKQYTDWQHKPELPESLKTDRKIDILYTDPPLTGVPESPPPVEILPHKVVPEAPYTPVTYTSPKWSLPKVISASETSPNRAGMGKRSHKTPWPCSCGCGTNIFIWPSEIAKKPNGPFYLNRQHMGAARRKVKPAPENLCYMCTVVGQCGNPQNCEANPPTAIDTPNPEPESTGVIHVPSTGLRLTSGYDPNGFTEKDPRGPEPKLCLAFVTDHTICSLSPNHDGDHADRQGNTRSQDETAPTPNLETISGEVRGLRYTGMRAPESKIPSSGVTGRRCPKCQAVLFVDGDDKDREYCMNGHSTTKVPEYIQKEVAERQDPSVPKSRFREPSHGGIRL